MFIFSHPYLINAARNVARSSVSTRFILASDVELYPSPNLGRNFEFLIKSERKNSTKKLVYVVPTFEIDKSERDRLPRSRTDLIKLVNAEKAVYFHAKTCKKCQKFPKIEKWLNTQINPGKITVQ